MRTLPFLLFASLLLLLSLSAHAGAANCDYDRGVDFSGYRTFGWVERQSQAEATDAALAGSDLVRKRIVSAVERELELKGLVKADTGRPDVYVTFYVMVEDRLDVDPGYGFGPWFHGGPAAHVHTYEEGTLIVDIIEGAGNELVWRGWISRAVPGPRRVATKINKVVAKLFRNYPPVTG